jgi:hypothetical protein
MVRRSRGNVVFTALAALFVLGAALVTPSSAHDSPSIAHTWRRHYRKLAQRIFYTKATSDARFVNTGEQASDAALLDGLDSTSFAPAGHGHAGEDITSGTVAEARIAAALARDAEVFAIVTGSDGADSGLDADLLDGQSSTAFAAASHVHAGDDITSGTVDESVVDALIARVANVFGLVLAADGANSGLDADLLDGQSSAAFAAAVHTHAGEEITSGTIAETRIAAALARDTEVFGIVTDADGPNSGLDADTLDGLSSEAFAVAGTESVQWFKEAADSLPGTLTAERVVFTAPADLTVTEVLIEPAAALTANDTNFATITVSRRNATGGGRTTIDSMMTTTTGTGNWTAFGTISLGAVTAPSVSAGQKVTIEIAKTGVGIVVPVMAVQIEYTVD